LRGPPNRLLFNLRAGAREETGAMVLHLDTVGTTAIAAIAQDDALGNAALAGVQFELTRLALRPQALVRLPVQPSAADVTRAVQAACKGSPQALVLGLNATNALSVIRAARRAGCQPQFYAMSEAGAELLAGAGAPGELAGVVVSQVLSHPRAPSVSVSVDYLRLAGAAPTYAGLEGFIYSRVIAEALRRCGSNLTRQCVVNALESRPVDAGGYRVETAAARASSR
jgi:branched-chain amino acid transport system substrate-binding protein